MTKILPYKNLFIGITDTLQSIFFDDKYADKALEKILRSNKQWGSKDRGFIAETVYDLVRWKRMVENAMNQEISPNNLWEFVGTWFVLQNEKLPNWPEFKRVSQREALKNNHKSSQHIAIIESIPDWLYQVGLTELGEEQWHKELKALNEPAKTVLRTNTLKINRKDLQKELKNNSIVANVLPNYPTALELEEKSNVFTTQAFKNGFFEIQDAGSQLIALYLNVEEGMRVIDACAGAGGKTLHLANLMNNKGQIIALDIYDWKLNELKKRAKRNGVQNIQTKLIESSKTIKRLENTADRLLIDSPCSGIGVLRRNPDAKWKLNPEFLQNVQKEQAKILSSYHKMLKINGLMVYATCSILPSENEKQVQEFLDKNPNFELIREKKVSPAKSGYDGFYMALLKKNA